MSLEPRGEVRPARWLVLVWRLPHGGSAPRVSVWRAIKRVGAVTLTPGAAVLPYREDLEEQLDWIAQEVEELGGDAWVLPVLNLTAAEEAAIRKLARSERDAEYRELMDQAKRARTVRRVAALGRQINRIEARDYFGAAGQERARAQLGLVAKPGRGFEPIRTR